MISGAVTAVALIAAAASPSQVTPPTAEHSYAARIVEATVARSQPRGDAQAVARVRTSAPWNHAPMQLLIDDVSRPPTGEVWYRVLLAKKPNGSYGWIESDYAQAVRNRWRISIDRSQRRMTILKDGRAVRRTSAVVGAKGTPTPLGEFAIREAVKQPNAGGFSGPWIFHLNANSQKLKSFDGGDGTIGIHGRGASAMGDPLGSAGSHGCVRVPNRLVSYMASRIIAGTPVPIKR